MENNELQKIAALLTKAVNEDNPVGIIVAINELGIKDIVSAEDLAKFIYVIHVLGAYGLEMSISPKI